MLHVLNSASFQDELPAHEQENAPLAEQLQTILYVLTFLE
jgi:hypothetical protein